MPGRTPHGCKGLSRKIPESIQENCRPKGIAAHHSPATELLSGGNTIEIPVKIPTEVDVPCQAYSSARAAEIDKLAVYSDTLEAYRECTVRILDCFQNAFALTGVGADASTSELSEAKFIDVGCGEGSFTLKYLLPRCSSKCQKLVGVDKSSAMLEHARLRHGHDMIEYLHLDIVSSDVDEFVKQHGHFTRVFSFHLLHWVKDRAQALKNIEKLIAPEGECFIVFEHCIPIFEVFMALA
ncbi:hypothetical protein HPB49_025641 [Dermacentor silvarum]|uniref:Uncharacterized protein n=1 Tax=Dermacentor silvarum TaxID=543639 RepID=A0ACB8CNW2_DERSI|nr:hypothetical protein HPB49_025641 [Dermacentor silvarum]